MGQFVELSSADGQTIPAYVAKPAGAPRGGIVVLQEIFGVNSHIRSVADGYAAAGYVAVAPAMFHRLQPEVDLGYAEADRNAGSALKAQAEALPAPGLLPDVQAAIDLAARESGGKVGIVGYCWGGLMSWRAAALAKGLSAAVTYYGGGMTTPEESARQPKVPVLSHFGEQDHWIPVDSVKAFEKAHPDVQVYLYAADHGFNCDQRGSYNAPAAATALERSLAFFAQHVG